MCTSRIKRRRTDMHCRPRIRVTDLQQQAKEEKDRCAPAGNGEGQICTGRPRIRVTDVHQPAKEERDRYAPAGQRKRGTDVHQQD
jgi:hypothetical protein